MSCWTCVPQGTIQVIQTWGKFKRFADPGCHCIVPCCGDEIAGALSTRIQSLDVAVETKTRDNVFVTIIVSTQYMVLREPERMYDAFYKLTDSREQIRSYIFDVVRSTVPRINLVGIIPTPVWGNERGRGGVRDGARPVVLTRRLLRRRASHEGTDSSSSVRWLLVFFSPAGRSEHVGASFALSSFRC